MTNKAYFFIRLTQGEAKHQSAALLEEALSAFWASTGEEPEKLSRTELGKPYFPSGRFHLSVTHTGSLYAAVFSPVPVGIDAERAGEARLTISDRKFSDWEKKLPFSTVWCGKEAVAKLLGGGLQLVNKISIKNGYAEYQGKRYTLREKIVNRTYRVMIATEEGRNWDGAETLSEK